MKSPHSPPKSAPRKRLGPRASRTFRFLAWLAGGLLLLFIASTVCLYVYGVPSPVVRLLVRKLGESGVPVVVDGIKLTSDGWRLSNFRYYSKNPDDVHPMVSADTVYLKRQRSLDEGKIRAYDIHMDGLEVVPSTEWIIGIPPRSELCRISTFNVGIGIASDSFVVRDARFKWMRTRFHIAGRIVNIPEFVPEGIPWYQHLLPVVIPEKRYQQIEAWLDSLVLNESAAVDIQFLIDQTDPSMSTARIAAGVDDPSVQGVEFSRAELLAVQEDRTIRLEYAALIKDDHSFVVSGQYNGNTGHTSVLLHNSITSGEYLALAPGILDRSAKTFGLVIDTLPIIDITADAPSPAELFDHVSGTFSLDRLVYQGVAVSPLSGHIRWNGSRLTIDELRTHVDSQPERAAETGSSMQGGAATGAFFWDNSTGEFGVHVDGELDPVLLIKPLSFNTYATNIVDMFRFREQPPKVRLNLGAKLGVGGSFYLELHAVAEDATVRDVSLSSVDVSAVYRQGVLRLDPVLAKQGTEYLKGSASLDFLGSVATFDGGGTIPPEAVERLIDPGISLFGTHLKVSGPSKIDARGTFDWGDMKTTDFEAQVDLQKLETPVALMDRFTATVVGEGPVIRAEDMVFSAHNGNGAGEFSIQYDPAKSDLPCRIDVKIDSISLKRWLKFMRPDQAHTVDGKLSALLDIETDLTRPFFETANGAGQLKIKDGQLADLPLFSGLTRMVRMVVPSFKVFTIKQANTDFELKEGIIYSDNAYFDGDLMSAKGHGKYSREEGFDAYVQVQLLNDSKYLKLFRVLTDPFLKLLQLKLEGTFSNPSWQMNPFL